VDRLIDEGKVEESKKSALVGVLGGYAYDIVNPELGKEANTELKQPMLDGDVKKWKESTPRKLFRNILAENQDYKPVGKIRNPVRIFVEKRYLSALKETNVTIGNEEIEIETLQGTEADEVYEVNTTQSGSKKIRPAKIINRIYDKIKSPFQIEYDKSRADFLKLGGAVVGAAFLITPEAISRIGVLDERYFMYFEDLDYCRRVKKAGLKTYYLPEAEFTHLHGESGKGLSSSENQWRRLVPSSQIYHGILIHYLIILIMWTSQKVRKLFGLLSS